MFFDNLLVGLRDGVRVEGGVVVGHDVWREDSVVLSTKKNFRNSNEISDQTTTKFAVSPAWTATLSSTD
jgi:hypothetical protein